MEFRLHKQSIETFKTMRNVPTTFTSDYTHIKVWRHSRHTPRIRTKVKQFASALMRPTMLQIAEHQSQLVYNLLIELLSGLMSAFSCSLRPASGSCKKILSDLISELSLVHRRYSHCERLINGIETRRFPWIFLLSRWWERASSNSAKCEKDESTTKKKSCSFLTVKKLLLLFFGIFFTFSNSLGFCFDVFMWLVQQKH